MAFVHASRNLQDWAKDTHDANKWDEHSGTGLKSWWTSQRTERDGMVAMGPFGHNWGIEMTNPPRSNPSEARARDSDSDMI